MNPFPEITEKIKTYENLISLLQKNNNLNHLGEYKKCVFTLSNNQEELEKLDAILQKDNSSVFKEENDIKASLLPNLHKVAGLLRLSVKSNRKKDLKQTDFLSENLDDASTKHLIKLTRNTLSLANKVGYYSLTESKNFSPKKLQKKIMRTSQISHDFGLTHEMIKKLEELGNALVKSMIKTSIISDERFKTIKKVKKICKENDKIIENRLEKIINIFEKPGSGFSSSYAELKFQTEKNLQSAQMV